MIPRILAQIQDWAGALTQWGASGVVIAWFMFRSESRMGGLERAMDTLARAHLLSVVANHEASAVVREQAGELLKELEERRTKKR